MKRTSLIIAFIFVTAASLMYLFGEQAVFYAGVALCGGAAAYCLIGKRKVGLRPAAVLLIGAIFCIYLAVFAEIRVKTAESYIGDVRDITCRVTEEPEYGNGSTRLTVKTDDGVKLMLYADYDSDISTAEEGDIISATLKFEGIDSATKRYRYSEGIYVSASVISAETVGHKETLYTRIVDLRRTVRLRLASYAHGDRFALLHGLVLGGNGYMSDELVSEFKICGVSHITAVSGMHIGTLCTAIVTLLGAVMGKRRAALVSLVPVIFAVMLAGATPSALRSGIMCGIMLSATVLLKRTDGLNSLGAAVAVMLLINPFYIVNLSFQLSCSAAAGVILVSPYANTLAERLVRFKLKFVSSVLKAIVITFVQSLGATVCTLPFQICAFGYISAVSPLANILICTAAMYAMLCCFVGIALSFLPIVGFIARVPIMLAAIFAEYIIACIGALSKFKFSYIPLGSYAVLLWIGLSLGLIAVWFLLDRVGGTRLLVLLLTLLLAVSSVFEYITSRDIVTVTAINTGNGFCATVTYKGKCVIIGAGDDYDDSYTVASCLRRNGTEKVEMLMLLSSYGSCFGGYEGVLKVAEPSAVAVPENFGEEITAENAFKVCDGESFTAFDGKLNVTPYTFDGNCAYLLNICGKSVFVSFGRFVCKVPLTVDITVSGAVAPENIIAAYSVATSPSGKLYGATGKRAVTAAECDIMLKFKQGKGIKAYAV